MNRARQQHLQTAQYPNSITPAYCLSLVSLHRFCFLIYIFIAIVGIIVVVVDLLFLLCVVIVAAFSKISFISFRLIHNRSKIFNLDSLSKVYVCISGMIFSSFFLIQFFWIDAIQSTLHVSSLLLSFVWKKKIFFFLSLRFIYHRPKTVQECCRRLNKNAYRIQTHSRMQVHMPWWWLLHWNCFVRYSISVWWWILLFSYVFFYFAFMWRKLTFCSSKNFMKTIENDEGRWGEISKIYLVAGCFMEN